MAGPSNKDLPVLPEWVRLDGVNEILSAGTFIRNKTECRLHLHSVLGSKGGASVGCLRGECSAYITIECIITEINCRVDGTKKCKISGHEIMKIRKK